MIRLTDEIIEALGGLTAIARMVRAPVSTVNSWKVRISDARLHHLQLAARAEGLAIDWPAHGMPALNSEEAVASMDGELASIGGASSATKVPENIRQADAA